MRRPTDLVDCYTKPLANFDRGFRHFLKTGVVGNWRADIQNDEFDGGPLGTKNTRGLLADPDSDYELSVHIFARGEYQAEVLCDEWAARCDWQVAHLCPLRKRIETYSKPIIAKRSLDGMPAVFGHVPMTQESFLSCMGLACAYWNFADGGNVPCLLVMAMAKP